ncbi:MAG: hypothetical protein Q8753_01340, partial [Pigeon pea little leaf phytoplasma]|nr:hypothetical protein [Pigeon pea little leaf phytoplasma]
TGVTKSSTFKRKPKRFVIVCVVHQSKFMNQNGKEKNLYYNSSSSRNFFQTLKTFETDGLLIISEADCWHGIWLII